MPIVPADRDRAGGLWYAGRPVRTVDLGILAYRDAWRRQEAAHAKVLGGGEETLFLVEHPHVITLGRRAEQARPHVLASDAELRRMRVDLVESDRGGDVTYHGPGQLVAYPVVRLADRSLSVGGYMKALQEAVIDALVPFGVTGHLDSCAPGVWLERPGDEPAAKICAVGVRVRRGVTLHGLALNVEPDLGKYNLIDPCGLGRPVTSLHAIMGGRSPSILAVKPVLARCLKARLAAAGPVADKA